jgi:hypothetical protein
MFCSWLGQIVQSLERTFHICFILRFTSFGWGVSEEKIKMWKVNGTCTYLAKRLRELSSTNTEVILTNFFAEPTVLLLPITSREYGIRQSGIRLKIINEWQKANLASSPWWPMHSYTHENNAIHIQRSSRAFRLEMIKQNEIKVLLMAKVHGGNLHHIYADTGMALFSCMYECIGHGEDARFAFCHWINPL